MVSFAIDDDFFVLMKDFFVNAKDGSLRVKFDRKVSRIDADTHQLVSITRNIEESDLNAIESIKIWIENGGGSIEGLCTEWCKTIINHKAVNDISLILPPEKCTDILENSLNKFGRVMNHFFENPYQILELTASKQEEFLASLGNSSPLQPADDTISHVFVDFSKHHEDMENGSNQMSLRSTRHNTVDIIVFNQPHHFTAEHIAAHADIEPHKAQAAINQVARNKRNSHIDLVEASNSKSHTQCEEHLFSFVQINAILQLVADIALEIFHLVPRRVNHLSLTMVNAFLAYKTLSAIKQNKFKFLHEDIQILFVLEIALIFGDVFIVWDSPCFLNSGGHGTKHKISTFFLIRAVFILLSSLNACMSIYIMQKYRLYHCWYVGDIMVEKYLEEKVAMPLMLLIKGKKNKSSTSATATTDAQNNNATHGVELQVDDNIERINSDSAKINVNDMNDINESKENDFNHSNEA